MIKPSQIDDLPAHIKKLNPHLFRVGPVAEPVAQQDQSRPLDHHAPPRQGRKSRLVVCFVRHSRGTLDDDNLAAGLKPLRDAIARTVGRDDAEITWEYNQVRTQLKRGIEVTFGII